LTKKKKKLNTKVDFLYLCLYYISIILIVIG